MSMSEKIEKTELEIQSLDTIHKTAQNLLS